MSRSVAVAGQMDSDSSFKEIFNKFQFFIVDESFIIPSVRYCAISEPVKFCEVISTELSKGDLENIDNKGTTMFLRGMDILV